MRVLREFRRAALAVLLVHQAASAQDVVRLGAVLPVTGKESKIGSAYKQATELAVKEVNDAGGVLIGGKKLKIELSLLDDTSDAAKSAQLVEQLITQTKVHAVIGGYGSQLVQAQSVVPERYGIPFISGGAGATSIYGRSKWVFGTLSPVEHLATTQMDFLQDLVSSGKLKAPLSIALITEQTEHGNDYAKGVKAYVAGHAAGWTIPVEQKFELYTADYRPLLGRVQAGKADLFMADAHLEDFISMQRTYAQMGLRNQMITYGARGADEKARKGLGPAADYIFASGWWSDLLPYPQVKAFNARYKAATGVAPEWYHALGIRDGAGAADGTAKGRLARARENPESARRAAPHRLHPAGRRADIHQDGPGRLALRGDAEQARRQGGPGVAQGLQDRRARCANSVAMSA